MYVTEFTDPHMDLKLTQWSDENGIDMFSLTHYFGGRGMYVGLLHPGEVSFLEIILLYIKLPNQIELKIP